MSTKQERSQAASLLGAKGGKVKSEAKAVAVRANGQLGGRPITEATIERQRAIIAKSKSLIARLREQIGSLESRLALDEERLEEMLDKLGRGAEGGPVEG